MNFWIFGQAAYIPIKPQPENNTINKLITPSGTKSVPSQIVNITSITQLQNIMRLRPKPRMVKIAAFLMI